MGDLTLRESKPQAITGSVADRFPPTSVRVGLTCEAQLGHEFANMGESESDISRDSIGHDGICCHVIADPIYKPLSNSNSNGA
jgi:hypothetical protein